MILGGILPMIRGLDTTVRKIRRQVFEEVARLGFTVDEIGRAHV